MNVAQVLQVFKNHKVIVLGLVVIVVLVGVGIRFLPPVVKTKYQEIQDQKFVSQLNSDEEHILTPLSKEELHPERSRRSLAA